MFENVSSWEVSPCIQFIGGTKLAYFCVEPIDRTYFVMYANEPGKTWKGSKREFQRKFVVWPPHKNLQEKLDRMEPFFIWRDRINREAKAKDCLESAGAGAGKCLSIQKG